jgi:hypothetical protein
MEEFIACGKASNVFKVIVLFKDINPFFFV